MTTLIAAAALVVSLVPRPQIVIMAAPAPDSVEEARVRRQIRMLCATATENLKLIDRRDLSEDERRQYDRVRGLVAGAQMHLKEGTIGGVLSGPLEQAKEAAREANALVRKHVKSDDYLRLGEQYLAGPRSAAAISLSGWSKSELEGSVLYLEVNGVPGTGGVNPADPSTALFTPRFTPHALAALVLLHTQVAFDGGNPVGPHLGVARRLLALIADADLPRDFRREWCLAVAAYLHGQLEFVGALRHIDEALARFPEDAQVLIAAGALHEFLALPSTELPPADVTPAGPLVRGRTRAVSAELRQQRAGLEKRKGEGLQRAETFYRKAIALAPDNAPAHLRLGRVLQLSGRADAALGELRIAAKSSESRVRYLASMFAGAIHEAAGRVDEALREYRTAIGHCPDCLSAAIALTQAQRKAGEREDALRSLDAALERDRKVEFEDPWWAYPLGDLWRRDAILESLRASILERPK